MNDTDKAGHPDALHADDTCRILVDQITDYAIFLLTPEGYVATWNPGAQRIKGYKPEEIIGKHFRCFYPPEEQKIKTPEYVLRSATENGHYETEGWRIRKDGSRFWANVIVTAIRDPRGHLVGYGKVTRDLTERKRAEEQLRALSGRLLKTQDEERQRLGSELHDTVGQYLVGVKMSLDSLASEDDLKPQFRAQVAECIGNVHHAIQEVRTLSYLLYPPMLEETGLACAIRWHLEGFSERSGIRIESELTDGSRRLPRDVELALFRVFQESLTNIHRHSQSKTAEVRLSADDGEVRLEVKDQGVGMSAKSGDASADSLGVLGVGIRGMHERVRQLGGKLEITSSSEGTTVTASVPIDMPSEGAGDSVRSYETKPRF